MGILKLMDFIKTKFPKAISSTHVSLYRDKTLAIDASNWLYQFLIKTQTIKNGNVNIPTDAMGNQTGHLIGLMPRILFCLQNNITPIWVFDGQPPAEKINQLRRRKHNRQIAEQKAEVAREEQEHFDLLKLSKRTTIITRQEISDAKKLLRLSGCIVVSSPSEAEPQCTSLVKSGLAQATVSEDMDTLAFGCPKMVRSFHKQDDSLEIKLQTLLEESGLTYDQFVDLCILCGCDYTTKVKNIGPVKAYSFLKKYGSIESVLEQITNNQKLFARHQIPEDFNYLRARDLFQKPTVTQFSKEDLVVQEFSQEKLIDFLKEKQFSEQRIHNWIAKMNEAQSLSIL